MMPAVRLPCELERAIQVSLTCTEDTWHDAAVRGGQGRTDSSRPCGKGCMAVMLGGRGTVCSAPFKLYAVSVACCSMHKMLSPSMPAKAAHATWAQHSIILCSTLPLCVHTHGLSLSAGLSWPPLKAGNYLRPTSRRFSALEQTRSHV